MTTTWTVYLFSDSGKILFEKEFQARDYQDAQKKGHKLVQPHVRKHKDAEDWVVEESKSKRAGDDSAEELAIRFLLAEDALDEDGKAKTAARALRHWCGQLSGGHDMPSGAYKSPAGQTPTVVVASSQAEAIRLLQPYAYLTAGMMRNYWYNQCQNTGHLKLIGDDKGVWFATSQHASSYVKGTMKAATMKNAKSNAKVLEVPGSFHKVVVQPPKAKRTEFPFEGYIDFQGLKIDVENVQGSTRSGTGPEGEWSTFMHAHYGEIRGTEGTDGDKLDVYVGENHDSSLVVVIHQHNPWDGKYDEDKVVIGCESVEEAIGLYKKQYDRPGFFKDKEYTAMPIGAFWRWVHDKKNKGKKVKTARVRLFTMRDVGAALKKAPWKKRNQGWEERYVMFYSVNFVESRNPGIKAGNFKVVWYTGGPGQFRDSKSVDTLKEAVALANRMKPDADAAAAKELGESPMGKLAANTALLPKAKVVIERATHAWMRGEWTVQSVDRDGAAWVKNRKGLTMELNPPGVMGSGWFAVGPEYDGGAGSTNDQGQVQVRQAMWKKGYAEGTPGALNQAKVELGNALALLRATSWNYLTSHWQIGGDSSYGDHLLFERMYEATVKETDALAEKLVGTYGIAAVDARDQAHMMAYILSHFDIGCPFERGLKVEQIFQAYIKRTLDRLEDLDQLSVGMDDFLRTLANDHETNLYLLQQRQGGVKMARVVDGGDRRHREFIARYMLRLAANVRTDTASFYTIAPEQLYNLVTGGNWMARANELWGGGEGWDEHTQNAMEDSVRRRGGAVFHTGGDGPWEARVEGSVAEMGAFEKLADSVLKSAGNPEMTDTFDASAHPTVVQYAFQKLRQGIAAAVRRTIKDLHGHRNYMLGGKIPLIDSKKLAVALLDYLAHLATENLPGYKAGRETFAITELIAYPWKLNKRDMKALVNAVEKKLRRPLDDSAEPGKTAAEMGAFKALADTVIKTAGWWAIDHDNPDDKLYNGDGPADTMDDALDDIDLAYRQSWGRSAVPEELTAVFTFCTGPAFSGDRKLNLWVDFAAKRQGLTPDELASVDWDALMKMKEAERVLRNTEGNHPHGYDDPKTYFTQKSLNDFDQVCSDAIKASERRTFELDRNVDKLTAEMDGDIEKLGAALEGNQG
mgnify:CR=1 FL=1|jgi:hypothetical protein